MGKFGLSTFVLLTLSTMASAQGSAATDLQCETTLKTKQPCTYYVKKISASELINKINDNVLTDEYYASPDCYAREALHGAAVVFWCKKPEVMSDLMAFIPGADKRDEFVWPDLVDVEIRLFRVTKEGLRQFGIGLSHIGFTKDIGTDKTFTAPDHSTLQAGIQTGSVAIDLLLKAGVSRGKISYQDSWHEEVPNSGSFNHGFSGDFPIVSNPASYSNPQTEEVGLTVQGQVTLHKDDRQIAVTGFSLRDGILVSPLLVKTIRFNPKVLYFLEGESKVILNNQTEIESTSRDAGIGGAGSSKSLVEESTLAIVTIRRSKSVAHPVEAPSRELTEADLSALPKSGFNTELFESARGVSGSSDQAQPIVGLQYDKKFLTAETLDQEFEISTKDLGKKQRSSMTARKLVEEGFFLDLSALTPEDFDKTSIVVKILFSPIKGSPLNFAPVTKKYNFYPASFTLVPYSESRRK